MGGDNEASRMSQTIPTPYGNMSLGGDHVDAQGSYSLVEANLIQLGSYRYMLLVGR